MTGWIAAVTLTVGALLGAQEADAPAEAPVATPPTARRVVALDLTPHALNGRRLEPPAGDGAHSFLVGGHLYGSPTNTKSLFPSPSLLANLPRLNESGASYFVTQGDMLRFLTPRHLELTRSSFVERLEVPLWIAVGNHDVAIRERFLETFPQPTIGFLGHGPILHLVLDSELDSGRISGPQLEFLRTSLDAARTVDRVRCVAIHSHKLLWTDGRDDLEVVLQNVNALTGYATEGEFARDVLPSVLALAAVKPVVWFSGDIGITGRLPLFYHREPDVDLTWIAVGLGDTRDDALVQVHVDAEGALRYEVLRMDGRSSRPLETFDLQYWKQYFAGR